MNTQEKNTLREEDRHVNLILRAADILECFASGKPELTLTELSNLTGLQKSRLLRLCGTLASRGYLNRNGETLKYSLGPKLMVLSRLYEKASDLFQVAEPIVKALTKETKETVSLFVVHGIRRLCLVKEDGEHPVRYVNEGGDVLDIHNGAGGMALLAFLEEETRSHILNGLMTDPATMLPKSWPADHQQEFDEIRHKGYAIGFGAVIPGVAAVAAPVFDENGQCCGSVSVAGPAHRFSEENSPILVRQLLEATAQISAHMGYVGSDSR